VIPITSDLSVLFQRQLQWDVPPLIHKSCITHNIPLIPLVGLGEAKLNLPIAECNAVFCATDIGLELPHSILQWWM
jgi:hypothetical protein